MPLNSNELDKLYEEAKKKKIVSNKGEWAYLMKFSRVQLHRKIKENKVSQDMIDKAKEIVAGKKEDTKSVSHDTLENVTVYTREEMTLLRATVTILSLKLINLEAKIMKKPFDEVFSDLQKKIQDEVERLGKGGKV